MYRYLPVVEIVESEEHELVPTCGIRILEGEGAASKELLYIPDVFTDIKLGKRVACLCTQEQLHPIHIFDVIEDFLP